jgi:hypothetical protein
MAEGKGFEPPKGISSFNDLANRRLQPLGHPPAGVKGLAGKSWPSLMFTIHGVCCSLSNFDFSNCQIPK